MSGELFVPDDFAVPDGLMAGEFRLAPLGPQHNEADYAAWTTSIDHIRATPGFPDGNWPHEMSLNDNLRDLERHARHFAERRGFTYTVIGTATGDVIGCVYIYPSRKDGYDTEVSSWVSAGHADLDVPLYEAVTTWLATGWPLGRIDYQAR